jgi:hypothetical protein
LLSNIVLDELDRELERRGHRFVRYADDCNIYIRSERSGQRVMASIVQFIESRMRLKVNRSKSAVARPEQRHFLGFSLRREPREGTVEVLLSERSRRRIRDKVRELTPRSFGQSLDDCIAQLNTYLVGWVAFFFPCTEAEQRTIQSLDAHIRRRLRAIVLRHCKRKRHIVQRLVSLGVQASAAWTEVYKGHRSLWVLSACFAVQRALGIRFFEERKLVSVEERWRKLRAQHDIASGQLMLPLR